MLTKPSPSYSASTSCRSPCSVSSRLIPIPSFVGACAVHIALLASTSPAFSGSLVTPVGHGGFMLQYAGSIGSTHHQHSCYRGRCLPSILRQANICRFTICPSLGAVTSSRPQSSAPTAMPLTRATALFPPTFVYSLDLLHMMCPRATICFCNNTIGLNLFWSRCCVTRGYFRTREPF
jgi:hypothetical protein